MTDENIEITLTDGLVQRIRLLQASENQPGLMLRVAVLGGWVFGFSV